MTITDDVHRVRAALSGLKIALAADDYDLNVRSYSGHQLDITITAGPCACPECLIPEGLMLQLIRTQLPSDIAIDAVDITIRNLQ